MRLFLLTLLNLFLIQQGHFQLFSTTTTTTTNSPIEVSQKNETILNVAADVITATTPTPESQILVSQQQQQMTTGKSSDLIVNPRTRVLDTILITFHLNKDLLVDLFNHFTPLNKSKIHNNDVPTTTTTTLAPITVPTFTTVATTTFTMSTESNAIRKRRAENDNVDSNFVPLQGTAAPQATTIEPAEFVKVIEDIVPPSPLKVKSKVQLSSQATEAGRVINENAQIGISVSQRLNEQFIGNSSSQSKRELDLSNFQAPSSLCPFKHNVFCNASDRFQSFDGSCNNLKATWLGKAETPYKRYLPAAYDDGIDSPRSRSVLGGPLPNPREVSRVLFNENNQFDSIFNHLTAIFGQFVAHDITSASISSGGDGKIVDCPCNNGNPSCMSINMPSNENIMRMSCMRFTRSSAAFSTFDCRLGHREQLNLLTSFLDGTQIYGPNDARMRDLRTLQQGQMKISVINNKPHLPQAQDSSCRNTDATIKCFAAGEGRTNENSGLTSVQTLFMREHNRIASELARLNPTWDDNRLFFETRKIIIGIYQNIIFSEYLPAIIGFNTAALFDLVPLSTSTYYSGYNANLNPQLANEFAAAAFRFGHTAVRNTITRFDRNNQRIAQPLILQEIIFRPVEIYNVAADGMESLLRGLVNEPASKFDTNFADTLQNHLFESRLSDGSVIAIDLAATNINRGRDHGIAGYNLMREKCGFRRAKTFQDLGDLIPGDKIQQLSSIYKHVDDIDLYAGGLAERPVSGGVVGSTFACVIANQFKELKKGDRFYYENGPSPTAFTLDQLREIKRSSLARLICDNVEITSIQPNAFMLPATGLNNQRISCDWLRRVDLTKWKSA